jgi:DNA-binding HxlR family transcriptional regulator
MALLDLLGRRWMLRVVWELAQQPAGFRVLQDRCDGMSPSVLAQRLGELRDAGIVEPDEAGTYALTSEGGRLCAVLAPLDAWARRWATRERGRPRGRPADP